MELPYAYIARTTWGAIGLSREERECHVYLVGKSGSGKSRTLFNLAMHDIATGDGVAVIDPHGDLAEAVADCVPALRTNAVCYLDAGDSDFPVGFNPLANIPPERHALAASGIVSAFKHLWRDSWGPRLEHFLFHGLMALLATPRATLIDLPRVYTDEQFRDRAVARLQDPVATRFWVGEYPQYDAHYRAEAAGPILNKVGQLAASPSLRTILGQCAPKFDLSYAMEHRGILIANLAKGRIGEQAANLLGSLLVSHLQLVAMERITRRQSGGCPFSCTSTNFSRLAPIRSPHSSRKRGNSRRISASRTSLLINWTLEFARRCSATRARSWYSACLEMTRSYSPRNFIRCHPAN